MDKTVITSIYSSLYHPPHPCLGLLVRSFCRHEHRAETVLYLCIILIMIIIVILLCRASRERAAELCKQHCSHKVCEPENYNIIYYYYYVGTARWGTLKSLANTLKYRVYLLTPARCKWYRCKLTGFAVPALLYRLGPLAGPLRLRYIP